jgi:hypothetical protein
MTKTQLWDQVQLLMTEHKANKALKSALEELLKPKAGGGSSQNPSFVENDVTYHYCRFHQAYEAEDTMVMSNGKSKGYCRASISIWNKRNSAIKAKEAEISELVMLGDFEQAKECSNELQIMKAELNDPAYYNLEEDWVLFNA